MSLTRPESPPDAEPDISYEQLKAWEWGMLALTPNEVERAVKLQAEIAARITSAAMQLI